MGYGNYWLNLQFDDETVIIRNMLIAFHWKSVERTLKSLKTSPVE